MGTNSHDGLILGPVTLVDCLAFVIFLAPHLVWQCGLIDTLRIIVQVLPFLLIQLPWAFVHDHFLISRAQQTPFLRQASIFEDVVIRCVRYAFANIPPSIGRVFFSREVALPFLRWRMLRHGFVRTPIHYREINIDFKGALAVFDPASRPDVLVYYAHGGGFSMGSTHFYLEFLMTWITLLRQAGYRNPAVLGVDYTLVPDASFPTQLRELMHGYEYALSLVGEDSSRVCVAGDSAGGTLILSLLLYLAKPASALLAQQGANGHTKNGTAITEKRRSPARPGMAVLISPWPTLLSPQYQNTESDFLDKDTLQVYGSQYAGGRKALMYDPLISPGNCQDVEWWREACPQRGVFVTYGKEEVFAPEVRHLVEKLCKASGEGFVDCEAEEGGIHAWPVASLFLCDSEEKRLKGLRMIVEKMQAGIPVR